MLSLICVLSALIAWSSAIPVAIDNCLHWSGQLNITAIRIPSCEAEPCVIRLRVPLDVEIDFVPSVAGDIVTTQASINYFGNYFFIYVHPFEEVCGTPDAHFQCPVEPNHTYTISSQLLIGVEPGSATELPAAWKVDVRVTAMKNDDIDLTDCSINLMVSQ